jgi:hypothetical protein
MKKFSIIIIGGLLSFAVAAQSLSPEVIASSGDYYENANASLSWTLGEIATETYSAGGSILTQGFQQPIGVTVKEVDILAFLEGPYFGTQMNTDLYSGNQIPNFQPYNTPPWSYPGGENAFPIPNTGVVDWVLVELRDAWTAGTATPATTIDRQAAFLLNDGSVVGVDGSSILQFNKTLEHKLFIVLWHRNHLGIMTANAIPRTGAIHVCDFSTSLTKVYNGGAGYKEVITGSGVYGMVGGDANADGDINNMDKILWTNDAGTKGYKARCLNNILHFHSHSFKRCE